MLPHGQNSLLETNEMSSIALPFSVGKNPPLLPTGTISHDPGDRTLPLCARQAMIAYYGIRYPGETTWELTAWAKARPCPSFNLTPAISYLRTSLAANVVPDKASDKRQREPIQSARGGSCGPGDIVALPTFLRMGVVSQGSRQRDMPKSHFEPAALVPSAADTLITE
jgi:hypothetical protein